MTEQHKNYQDRLSGFYERLSEPMPAEALHVENSRGFPLTSIKAAFVIERLNQVFGLLGHGWRYFPGPIRVEEAKDEIALDVAVQWRVAEDGGCCPPIYWGHRVIQETGQVVEGWYLDTELPAIWSEPIIATGGSSSNRKGSTPMADARKSALTNGLTKAASRMGIGVEIWKGEGENSPPPATSSKRKASKEKPRAKTANGKITTLTGIQKQAQAQLDKLTCEDKGAEAKEIQTLARQMDKVGLEMQPVRLIHVLFGEGDLSYKRVLAAINVTTSIDDEGVDLINAAAWIEKKDE